MWGRRVLFDYKNKDGVRLQGILALPDDYKAGEKRPMLVTFYEKNSQNLHRYNAPSYLTGMGGIADGGGEPRLHHDAARHPLPHRLVAQRHARVRRGGDAEGDRDGLRRSRSGSASHGHSYGGEGAAFIGTRSKMFAAVGMGAGVTDLYTDFSQNWGWSYQVTGGSGANGERLLPLRPGPLGLLAVGQARGVPLRVGAHARAQGRPRRS